jgi:transcriptional regulator with XRE-family HTH domain
MRRPIDVSALYGALDSKRRRENLSWRGLARKLELSPSIFTRLAQGSEPDGNNYFLMTEWLEVSNDDFVERESQSEERRRDTVGEIATFLHSDKKLKPETAEAITRIVEAAYREMAEEK